MSLLSKIGKLFGHSHKAYPKQNANSTSPAPLAPATTGNTSGISKQISFESTSSCASSVPSTISSSPSQARVSLLDACRYGPLEAIPSTQCLSEIQEVEETSAIESSSDIVAPPTTGGKVSVVLDDHSESCTPNISETTASDAALDIPLHTEPVVSAGPPDSAVQQSVQPIDPTLAEVTPLPTEAAANPSLNWGAGSWTEIFSSDSTSSSLCDIVQEREEQTSTQESNATTAVIAVSSDNVLLCYRPRPWIFLDEASLWLMSNPDKDVSAYVPTTRLQYYNDKDEECFIDEAVDPSDDDDMESLYAPRKSSDAMDDSFVASIERDDTPCTTTLEEDKREYSFAGVNGNLEPESCVVANGDLSGTQDTPAAQSSLTWKTPSSWKAVFNSNSTSSSLCDVVQDPIDKQPSRQFRHRVHRELVSPAG